MKGSCLITRREGTTRQMFRDYYENNHAPLGMRFYPFQKYVRNHVIEASADIDFDVIMETRFDDNTDVAAIDSGKVRVTMDVDERHFMEQGVIRSASVEERVLAGPPLDIAGAGARRQMLLFNADLSDTGALSRIEDWGKALGASNGVMRVTLDTRRAGLPSYGQFPYDAILSLWLNELAEPVTALEIPEGISLAVWLLTEVCETTPDELSARFGSAAA